MAGFFESRRKFYSEDLQKYFAVELLHKSIIDPDIEKYIINHDITKDKEYHGEYIQRNIELFSPYIARGFQEDRRFYVSLVSPEMGYGAFADLDIPAWTPVGVYTGIITNKKANTDYAWIYHTTPVDENGNDIKLRVNARFCGNLLRFINHSQTPNCNVVHVPFNNRWYTVYLTNQHIKVDSELTVSYGDNYWKNRDFLVK
jgi:SET domain-containing protein